MWEFHGNTYDYIDIVLVGAMFLSFFIQSYYYWIRYARIPGYRQHIGDERKSGVSVVIIVNDNFDFVEKSLPLFLEQNCDIPFEIVVVDNGSSVPTVELLDLYSRKCSYLKTTRINPDPKFRSRRKFVLNVGIKAASYQNIIFTDNDCIPNSDKWLSLMAKGFVSSDVVIGYCGIERTGGFINKAVRFSNMMSGIRFLSSAIAGTPYKVSSQNVGYSSALYFANKGFNYLNMNIGDEDLFIQSIATKRNTAVIMNPKAIVVKSYNGLASWINEKKFLSYAFKYYPLGVRFSIFMELFSRLLFFATVAEIIVIGHSILWIVALSLLLLRWVANCFVIRRIAGRIGEKGVLSLFLFYDVFSPFFEMYFSISRRLRPSKGIWT